LALAVAPGIVTLIALFRRWKNAATFGSAAGAAARRPHDLAVLAAGLGLIVLFVGILLSQSRGGTIVGVLAIAATTAGLFFRGSINRASGLALMALLVAGGVGLVVAMAGQEPFQRSAALLTDHQSLDDLSNQRFRLWKADLH